MKKISGLIINEENAIIGNYKSIIHDRLKRLFFTPIDEQIGALNKGSYIPDMIYDLSDSSIAGTILGECELLIMTYEPLIELKTLEVKTEDTDTISGVLIKVDFYYTGTSIEDSVIIDNFS